MSKEFVESTLNNWIDELNDTGKQDKGNIEFILNIKNNTELELNEAILKDLTHELQAMLDKNFPKIFRAVDIPKTEGIPFMVGAVIDEK